MAGRIGRILEWIGRAETIGSLLHTEFVRSLLIPTSLTVMTGATGYLGGIPAMWIMAASSLVFAGVSTGLLSASVYRERKSPLNKLRFNGTVFNFDLIPTRTDREQRRAVASASRKARPPADLKPLVRELKTGQLGVELINTATFPISMLVEFAESEIEGMTPPRTKYPKEAVVILPGVPVRACDERIELNNLKCGRIEGKLKMKVRYGLPGNDSCAGHECNAS